MLCYGCSGQHRSRAFGWLSLVATFAQRGELISPFSVGRVAMNLSHAHGSVVQFILTYLSFREAKPRKQIYRWLNTQGSEAVLKVQLQRRAGKKYVGSNQQSRVRLGRFDYTTLTTQKRFEQLKATVRSRLPRNALHLPPTYPCSWTQRKMCAYVCICLCACLSVRMCPCACVCACVL